MKIYAEKNVVVFASVTFNGWDFKVWPDGTVEKWVVNDDNFDGFWSWMSEYDSGYDEIKAAGLEVLIE